MAYLLSARGLATTDTWVACEFWFPEEGHPPEGQGFWSFWQWGVRTSTDLAILLANPYVFGNLYYAQVQRVFDTDNGKEHILRMRIGRQTWLVVRNLVEL